ncbi:MAG: tRNA-dihydrouridine synthase, partial [Thermoplasmata archaeon]|nr:tRNA-dihydrouridine synthase [Thermoplasmata archaeon]
MTDLSTTVAGMGFPNPVMLASGILDETGASMARVIREGAGGVVTKSIGLEPRLGHPNPTVVEVQGGLLNAMGLPNPGMAAYADEIREAKREGEKRGTPVIASIFGANPEDFAILARMAKDAGADGIELNLSCPH